MPVKWNPSETPDYPLRKKGFYDVHVDSLKVNEANGPLRINLRASIIRPEDDVDEILQGTFWLGTEDDPSAENPRTRKEMFGAWKRFLKACEVQCTGDLEEECEAAQGSDVTVRVGQNKEGTKNYLNAYYRLGAKEAGYDEGQDMEHPSPSEATPTASAESAPSGNMEAARAAALRDEE